MSVFFFNDTATTEIYTLSLHDALPICLLIIAQIATFTIPKVLTAQQSNMRKAVMKETIASINESRSEEHTSELQSRQYLVCRLLLEKKKTKPHTSNELRK